MNSKQRVLTTISHQEPDRVPVGEWGIDHDHVGSLLGRHTYWRNRRDSTLALWEGRRDEVVESMIADYLEIIEKLDFDIVPVTMVPPKGLKHPDPPRRISENRWEDSQGRVFAYAASNDSIMCLTPSIARMEIDENDIAALQHSAETIDPTEFELVDAVCKRYAQDRAIVFRDIDVYDMLMEPFGGDQSHKLTIPLIAPDQIARLIPPALAWHRAVIEHCARKGVAIGMQGHDYGMNSGCFIDPSILREVFFSYQKQIVAIMRENGIIPFFHCCGKIWDILPDFVAQGYRGYQSVQATAGMDWQRVKHEYGNQLAIWAGVQCETLISGSFKDVEDEVSAALELFMPGGGFIFGSTNSVQFGAKTENYLRALEVVRKYATY
ncbi:MAG: hypothetical protein GF398_21495 [Chitinivibrionales bacterium]|nr:hypothetical protein [Chitinivibrionales bacterium]